MYDDSLRGLEWILDDDLGIRLLFKYSSIQSAIGCNRYVTSHYETGLSDSSDSSVGMGSVSEGESCVMSRSAAGGVASGTSLSVRAGASDSSSNPGIGLWFGLSTRWKNMGFR